jgi:predicted ATPase
MITSLGLKKYRSHDDSVLHLGPISLLIGPAGSGKSNIFRGLLLLQNSVRRSLVELFPPGLGEFHWVRSHWAEETDAIGLSVELAALTGYPDQSARYHLKIASGPEGLYVLEETLSRQAAGEPEQWVFQRNPRRPRLGEFGEVGTYDPTVLSLIYYRDRRINFDRPGPQFARQVAETLGSIAYFHLEASALKSPGGGQFVDCIAHRGERLPDFLSALKSQEALVPTYDTILKEMREVLPDLESILVTQIEADRQGLAMSFRGQQGYIAATDLSDGTLLTLGLLSIIHSPRRPSMLCIEEPETGLHPRRLRWLFDRLIALAYPQADERPIQVVVSSHSPYLVDLFGDLRQFVQVVERTDGHTHIRSLPEIQAILHEGTEGSVGIGQEWATGLYEEL